MEGKKEDEHNIPLVELYGRLNSSEKGLTLEEAKDRLKNGKNVLKTKRKTPLFIRFLQQFVNFFALLLLFGATLALVAERLAPGQGNLYIAIALYAVVFLNATFTFLQQFQSERIMDSFRKMMPSVVKVQRDGDEGTIDAEDLVPGDIIFLEEGDRIPADARLLEAHAMKVDHSAITGEAEPQLRTTEPTHDNIMESRNMLFSGTLVLSGNGRAIVYGTGMNTQIGKIVALTHETKELMTPLHKELRHFIKIISAIAIFLGITFFIVSVALGKGMMPSIIFAIGIIVANVPEGLLPTVTLALSMAAARMSKKNALIKNLESVETLGSTTVICTDKTGTITQNKMSVHSVFADMQMRDIHMADTPSLKKMLQCMSLCNNAHKSHDQYLGDPTETALLEYADKFSDVRKEVEQHKRVHEDPFSSSTKRMITQNMVGDEGIYFMKGAPEVVLRECGFYMDSSIKKLDQKSRKTVLDANAALASKGERVLGFAYKDLAHQQYVWLGLIGMVDPPRPEITEAINKCETAGIKVVMITGDYSLTAVAIAREVGIIPEGVPAVVTTGEKLEEMSDAQLEELCAKDGILFARMQPQQKLRIVQAMQKLGHVVTVTGDGVNDAPALKNADMGVSMGKGGTEVAREASDMVLMDDNFATIVGAVEEGRTIYANIKKFIAYILTSNIPEILPFIFFALFSWPLAVTVVLILAIDLGTDLIPALGLGSERPERDVMRERPRDRKERLLTGKLLFYSYGIVGMLQAAAGFFAFFYILLQGGWTWGVDIPLTDPLYQKAVTAFFASIVICQIADVLICKTRRATVFKSGWNGLIFLGILSELALLAIIMYFPPANVFFGTQPIGLLELMLPVPFALFILFGDELRKFFLRRGNVFIEKYLTW